MPLAPGCALGLAMELQWIDLGKLLAAVAGGALIGLERELHGKTAGFRTNIMICLGAALFTVLSVRLAEFGWKGGSVADPARIAAQIVTGVGFLGAGAIIQLRRYVVGLTTAATIWVVASVGMAFGAGAFALGALAAILTSAVLFGLGYAEKSLAHWHMVARFDMELDPRGNAPETIERLGHEHGVRFRAMKLSKTPTALLGRMKVIGPKSAIERFHRALLNEESVRTLQR